MTIFNDIHVRPRAISRRQDIIASTSDDDVVATTTGDRVVTTTTKDNIIAGTTIDRVVPGCAGDRVVAAISDYGVHGSHPPVLGTESWL